MEHLIISQNHSKFIKRFIYDDGNYIEKLTGEILSPWEYIELARSEGIILSEEVEYGIPSLAAPIAENFINLKELLLTLKVQVMDGGSRIQSDGNPDMIVGDQSPNTIMADKDFPGNIDRVYPNQVRAITNQPNPKMGRLIEVLYKLVVKISNTVVNDEESPAVVAELTDIIAFTLDGISWGNTSEVARNWQHFQRINEKYTELTDDFMPMLEFNNVEHLARVKAERDFSAIKGDLIAHKKLLNKIKTICSFMPNIFGNIVTAYDRNEMSRNNGFTKRTTESIKAYEFLGVFPRKREQDDV